MAKAYPEMAFGGFSRVDGTVSFYSRVQALLESGDVVLDLGCGRGAHADKASAYKRQLHNLQGKGRTVVGVDIDRSAAGNPTVDEFRLIEDLQSWPVADESVGLVLCDYVLEHVRAPEVFFGEMQRVLKPGGRACIRTPNLYGYVAMIAKMVPNGLHGQVASRVQQGRSTDDFFPTYYRCNTRRRLEVALAGCGLSQRVVYAIEGEPAYLGFSITLFNLASYVHRWLPPLVQSRHTAIGARSFHAGGKSTTLRRRVIFRRAS